ncbi:MAG: sialate O-acetylesterase, partial [Planctomycetes bacterium]|nr:sialate O-acetylesterase [Planctomycetota bacterium]
MMNRMRTRLSATLVLFVFGVLLLTSTGAIFADVKLPAIIGDNMVLQRGKKVPIWGWAKPGEEVMVGVSWTSMKWAITANEEGKWLFKMNPPKTSGPHEMTISGKNVIKIQNILVGEVWVCSG